MNMLRIGYFILLFFSNIMAFSFLTLAFNLTTIFLTNLFLFVIFFLTDHFQGFLTTKGKINALNINTIRLILCAVVAIVFLVKKTCIYITFFSYTLLTCSSLFFLTLEKIKNSITNVKICMCKIKK